MRTPKWFKRTQDTGRDLWWVRLILNVGRPVVAVFVLVMCAPGEHYLAHQAGWSPTLAWGMPGTLTAYAGIAAVVATKRAPGTPGKATAVWGAILAILLAMAAQPIAHLYGKPGLTAQQVALVITVSCIPALVFGHLLHMAAVRTETPDAVSAPVVRPPLSVSALASALDTDTDVVAFAGGQPDTGPVFRINPKPVRRTADGSVPSLVRDLVSADPDISDEDIRTAVLDKLPDTKPDTLRKAIARNRPDVRTA
jgi:hypothetical protein